MRARRGVTVAIRAGQSQARAMANTPSQKISVLPPSLIEELERAPVMPGVAGGKWEGIRFKAMEFLMLEKKRYDDLTRRRKSKVREIVIYLAFVLIFSYVCINQRDTSSAFFLRRAMQAYIEFEPMPVPFTLNGVKNFAGVAQLGDYHDWMESVMLRRLRPNGDYYPDGSAVPKVILGNNIIVGKVKVRQYRTLAQNCSTPHIFHTLGLQCYNSFSDQVEDTRDDPDGIWSSQLPGLNYTGSIPAWFKYTPSRGSNFATSFFRSTYGSGGYEMTLDLDNLTNALSDLRLARAINWVDYNGTRAVMVELTTYNPNVNLFFLGLYLFEFPQTAMIVGSTTYRVVNLTRTARVSSLIDLVIEAAMFLFVFFFAVMEARNIIKDGYSYWLVGFNYLSIINILVFFIVFAIEVYTISSAFTFFGGNDPNNIDNFHLHYIMYWTFQIYNWNSFNALLTWIRLTKYMDLLSPKTRLLSYTLAKSASDVFIVLLIFIVIFFGYSIAFTLGFGQDVENFLRVDRSLLSMYLTILGQFSFNIFRQSNRILGPILFITYILIMVFCILNMFLTVIMKNYELVAQELEEINDELPSHFRKIIFSGLKSVFVKPVKKLAKFARKKNAVVPEGMPPPKSRERSGGVTSATALGKNKDDDDEDVPEDEQYLNDQELEEIFMVEQPRLAQIGIVSVKQMKKVADVDMNGFVSVSEILNFQAKVDEAEEDEGTAEEEETYLIMKILERTNAIISEEKAMLKMLQDHPSLNANSNLITSVTSHSLASNVVAPTIPAAANPFSSATLQSSLTSLFSTNRAVQFASQPTFSHSASRSTGAAL